MRLVSKYGWIEFDAEVLRWAYSTNAAAGAPIVNKVAEEIAGPLAGKIGSFFGKKVMASAFGAYAPANTMPLFDISNVHMSTDRGAPLGAPAAIGFDFIKHGQLKEGGMPVAVEEIEAAKEFTLALSAAVSANAIEEPERDPDVKVCPDCAEEVKYAARKCRYCGHEFA
jgi:hypothetical protein